MRNDLEFIIKKIYPENWDKIGEQERIKKEKEFGIASFFLYNYPTIKDFLKGTDYLCVQFYEKPDFFLYSNEESSKKLGLEITDCYVNTESNRNILSIYSDLEKICKEVVDDIVKNNCIASHKRINYINVTFTHEIMIGAQFDKKGLKSELRNFILDKDKYNGEYVCKVDVGYSVVYPEDKLKILLNSNMAYIVPRIGDVVQIQKNYGIENPDPVLRCIAEKEKKLVAYKQGCKYAISEWWLCINIPENAYLNPVSYNLPENFTSKYNKIFLVTRAFYGCGVHLIYNNNNVYYN